MLQVEYGGHYLFVCPSVSKLQVEYGRHYLPVCAPVSMLQVEYGGHYLVHVSGSELGARSSEPPALCDAPPIPPPHTLTFSQADNSFYWRNARALPHDILTHA